MAEHQIIARIHTGFPEKFGIPRQSGLADTKGKILFEPDYRNPEMLRGIEGYSHLWLIWEFSEAVGKGWHPTVRPPRLGGNQRMGVFATRSPFRPNPIGLSCVRLEKVELDGPDGPVLYVTPRGMSGKDPCIREGDAAADFKPGSKALLPGRSGENVRYGICRHGSEVSGKGRTPSGKRHRDGV